MCDRCGWRELVAIVGRVIAERPAQLVERRRDWLERIRVTADDDRHCGDHQKAVVRRISREAGSRHWRDVPKATDTTEWSEARRKAVRERRRLNRACDRHGRF